MASISIDINIPNLSLKIWNLGEKKKVREELNIF